MSVDLLTNANVKFAERAQVRVLGKRVVHNVTEVTEAVAERSAESERLWRDPNESLQGAGDFFPISGQ